MRQNVGRLVRKTLSFSKNVHYLQRHIALEDAVYNFVKPHGVLEAEAEKLAGFENLISVTGIGARSAGVLLSVIGEVEDFADENKLASYFGIVPKIANSNEKVNHGRITKRGNKAGRTTLGQCTLVAIRYNSYLKKYYEQVKERRGHGKAKIAAARKYLGVIYNTLKNNWVFADFNNFELAE